ncbi:MAG TPA: AarF/UbiB family protein, partial [Longimicrobiales bacterium]|nr:AarF/UbiB family protein [Longimicrobiales bacterium]
MSLSLAPARLKRYKDILLLLARHGRGRLVREATLEDVFRDGLPDAPEGEAEHLAAELEELGPTFVKLGQLLSTRPDFLPPAYLEALTRLQDRLEPFPFEEVEEIVEAELGVRLSKAFASFDPVPMAAASLGQVHRAELRDGRPVAVKVQRPGVRERVLDDLEVLEEVAGLVDAHPPGGRDAGYGELVEEFRRTIVAELDYRREAAHLVRLGDILSDFPRLVVPAPVMDYTTSRVLTMDYIRGRKVTKLSPLVRLELDGASLVDELFEGYLRQVLVHGFFHADPHPGNVFLTDDRRLALIDLGMVATVGDELQEQLLHLLLAVADGRGGDAADATLDIAAPPADAELDREAFREDVDTLVRTAREASAEEAQVGRLVLEVARRCGDHGLRLPSAFAMLGRTLMALDQIGR